MGTRQHRTNNSRRAQGISAGLVLLASGLLMGSASPSFFQESKNEQENRGRASFEMTHRIEPTHLEELLSTAESSEALPAPVAHVYREREYRPVWLRSHESKTRSRELVQALEFCPDHIYTEATQPARLAAALRLIQQRPVRAETLAKVERDLTKAYLSCVDHLAGEHHLEPAELGWEVPARERQDPVAVVFDTVAEAGTPEAALRSLQALKPPHPQAARLTRAVADYRQIVAAGGWQTLPSGDALEMGDVADSEYLTALAERLAAEGFMTASAANVERGLYSTELAEAVARFQRARGLIADGILGKKTLAALNVPADQRLRQLELNLERTRWLPAPNADSEIWVNLAAYKLWVLENGQNVESMKVMIGKPTWQTPVFRDYMEYLVVNPAWNVPASIAIDEVIERFETEPEKAIAEGFEVYDGYGPDAELIDPTSVDWQSVSENNFQYRVRQKPGRHNPLGQVKFIFPNEHSVYLHDTTAAPALFERANRAFSHGCVRLERPWDLAKAILPGDEYTELKEILASRERKTLYLDETIPVTLVYLTAWVNEDGVVEMYEDIYDRDSQLHQTLASASAEDSEPQPLSS